MILQLILILTTALLAVLFTFQNPHHVQMHFMAWQTTQFPLIALILISMLLGVIITAFMSLKTSLQLSRKIRNLQSELDGLKKNAVGDDPDEAEPRQQDGAQDFDRRISVPAGDET